MRIFYFSPEMEKPSGGVQVLFNHVRLLNKHNFDAQIIYPHKKPQTPFQDNTVPSTRLKNITPQKGDHFVIPEGFIVPQLMSLPFEKHIFFQSILYIFENSHDKDFRKKISPENTFCCSKMIQETLRDKLSLNPSLIPNSLNNTLFSPNEEKTDTLVYMPRKNPFYVKTALGLFTNAYPEYANLEFFPIVDMTQDEVATHFARAKVFLYTSLFEGFGLPPLEAMLSNTLVVGSHAFGGREYVNNDNGFWTELGDVVTQAEYLKKAFDLWKYDTPAREKMQKAGRLAAAKYKEKIQENALLAYWNKRK